MTKKKNKFSIAKYKGFIPYIVAALAVLILVTVGSIDKHSSEVSLSLDTFAANDYNVSTDQLSELYMVADLSDALGLASAPDVATNYIITNTMYDSGQTSTGRLEKPSITNIATSRGVVEYVVEEGDNMDSIAAKHGVSTDDIRWSNNLKTTDVSPGTTLYIPSTSGIVYTVKSDDTIDSIAEKYGSSAAEIIALNDLEVSGISEGMRIVIRGGSLPETERPEYVAPVRQTTSTVAGSNNTYTYTYLGSSSVRQNIEVVGYFYDLGGPWYTPGQCTQWAWYNRQDLPLLGNANAWARNAAAAGYRVDNIPSAGAVLQTTAGWYGHVGYVEAVNPDGSIIMSEMNYGIPYRVIRSTIPASEVGNFNYIH